MLSYRGYFSFLFFSLFFWAVVVAELGFRGSHALLEVEFDNFILKHLKNACLSSLQQYSQVINLSPTFKECLQVPPLFLANILGPHILRPSFFLTLSFITLRLTCPLNLGSKPINHQLPRSHFRHESESPASPLGFFFWCFNRRGPEIN